MVERGQALAAWAGGAGTGMWHGQVVLELARWHGQVVLELATCVSGQCAALPAGSGADGSGHAVEAQGQSCTSDTMRQSCTSDTIRPIIPPCPSWLARHATIGSGLVS